MAGELRGVNIVDTAKFNFELISTVGNHCEVWRTAGTRVVGARKRRFDLVVKKYRRPCSVREVQVLEKEHRRLKSQLEDIVPSTLFARAEVDGEQSVVALSQAVNRWFNVANPTNEDEAIPLLRRLPKARNQLLRFVHAARKWEYEADSKIIDLYGVDNLVLNTRRELRYLDSFHVFFYADMLRYVEDEDGLLERKVDVSVKRREYLDYLLKAVNENPTDPAGGRNRVAAPVSKAV
jgi:hypothetical protein